MNAVDKGRVKDALLRQVEAELQAARSDVARKDSAAKLDQDSSFSVDDQSQAAEAGDLGGLLESREQRQAAIRNQLEKLDFGPRSEVAPGAIIGFDGDRYVVGVVAAAFECDGATYEGIAADAPIYPAIEGLHAGDTFSFAGHDHRIDFVS
ncbi:hypothetical protein [Kribbella sp. NPDC000426]|uniref:hypothetical protein n=1 Tax=Kribbella sp. NPDC000426 TaxID=3154255 RepID=UPI00332D54DB